MTELGSASSRNQFSAREDTGIVYFGNDWFAENRTSSHHIATRLAERFKMVYVDSPGMRAPTATGRDLKRLIRKVVSTLRRPSQLRPGFWYCTVPQIPFRRLPGVDWLNRRFGIWAVRRAMRMAGIRNSISWFVVPHPGFMAQRLGERLCVYYCIDDYAAHPGVNVDLIGKSDLDLTRRADIVFVAPPALMTEKQRQNASTWFSPHGVDAALFGKALDPATPIPPLASQLSRPVIGFFGLIADWIDTDLICWLADSRPEWTLLLVGAKKTSTLELERRPNIHMPGPQPYADLPGWAKSFDVAIIPYRLNRQVQNANPLKLREYLATGRPVVTVRNPEIERFSDLVRIADDRESFLRAIEESLKPEPPEDVQRRVASVRALTWDNRVTEVLEKVSEAYAKRN